MARRSIEAKVKLRDLKPVREALEQLAQARDLLRRVANGDMVSWEAAQWMARIEAWADRICKLEGEDKWEDQP